MNRDALDEWFSQADDILTDWRPGGDAMHARPPADEGEDRLPARADSYYDQGDGYSWRRGMRPADEAAAHARTVAELERLRSTVMVGPGSGWVVEIRDGVGRWQNLSRTGWTTGMARDAEGRWRNLTDGTDDTP